MQLSKFEPSKTLPSTVMDFILRNQYHGIISPEFKRAIERGDADNISEGLDSIILNAETKTKIKLSAHDKLMAYFVAQDEIVHKLLAETEAIIDENYGR